MDPKLLDSQITKKYQIMQFMDKFECYWENVVPEKILFSSM